MNERGPRKRIEQWQEYLSMHPASAVGHFNLALAYTDLGLVGRAEELYRKALELDDSLVEAWVNLGGVLLLKWDFAGCLKANQEAVARQDDCVLAHYNMGQAYLYLGDAEGVVRCYRRVLELEPRHPAGHYYLAVGLLATGHVDQARRAAATAIKLGHRPSPEFLRSLEKASQEPRSGGGVPVLEIGG